VFIDGDHPILSIPCHLHVAAMASTRHIDGKSSSKSTPAHNNSLDSMTHSDAGPSRSPGSPSDDEEEAEAKRRRVQVRFGKAA
jgi:hypothetical protein